MKIVGNLDVETTWARMDAAARRARGEKAPRPDDPRFALPEPVMKKISAAATLMRVFAQSDDDVLWTPRPVEPSRMANVEWWVPKVRLESGPMPEAADVWWGEPTEVAARVNHRSFAWYAKLKNGERRLPGASLAWNIEDLERCVRDLAAASHGDETEWVAKAPLSAAGRLRVRGVGSRLADEARAQAGRLLELHGVLVFEPWVARIVDFGVSGDVLNSHVRILGMHRLEVDRAGRFVGISDAPIELDAQLGVRIGSAAALAAESLRAAGFVGGFGIDGYLYGDPAAPELQCISEINARRTFGNVALRIIDMAQETIVGPKPLTLRFGRGAPPADTIPLLLPGTDDDTSAWLEVQELRRE